MSKYDEALNKYKELNKSAQGGGAVFFGADWIADFPIYELAKSNLLDTDIYNRSLKGLTIDLAEKVIDTCVYSLSPEKVFISIGENDILQEDFNCNDFSEKFEWLLYAIHSKCNCTIYILSVVNEKPDVINKALKSIAEKYNCEYIDVQSYKDSFSKFFSKLCFFLRKRPVSFLEAMTLHTF